MTQSGKSKEEVIAMIKEAKKRKEASKSWADYDPNEPFDPSDFDLDFLLPKRKTNIPPPIDTNINKGRIDNPILNDKDEVYNLISKQLPQNNLEQILTYLQEINNNVQLPISFKNTVKRFVEQFNTIDETTNSFVPQITLAIDINLPDIDEQQTEISEDILAKHIKDIMKEHSDVLDILTTRHVIKLLEARLNTNLQQYKPFIKKTILENIPQKPKPQPKPHQPEPSMEDLFGPESPSPKDEEIEIEPPKRKSQKQKSKSKSPKRKSVKKSKSKKSKSPKRKSVKKSKSKKSKSVKKSKSKSKSKKAKSVKKSKSVKRKSKSVKRKSVKKSKKAKSVKKSKSVKRKSVKKSKSKKAKSVKRKSKKAKSVKKSKSVKRKSKKAKSVKKSKSVKRKSKKAKSIKKSKSVKRKSKKAKSVKKSKSKSNK